eukprot:gene6745-7505_t
MGKTTLREAFYDVITVLNEVKNNYIQFPRTLEEKPNAIATFRGRSSMPNVLGDIDGMHIKIRAPRENKKDFYSRYQQYDVVCQGIVDGNMKFLDIVAGFPSSMHDGRVLRNTSISTVLDRGFGEPVVDWNNTRISPYLIRDSEYPLIESIMKP